MVQICIRIANSGFHSALGLRLDVWDREPFRSPYSRIMKDLCRPSAEKLDTWGSDRTVHL